MFISKFDPKTLKLTEYPVKTFKPDAPVGLLSSSSTRGQALVRHHVPGRRSAISIRRPARSTYYPLPPECNDDRVQLNFVGLRHDVDGKVWTKSVGTAGHLPARSRERQMGEIPSDRRAAAGAGITASIR